MGQELLGPSHFFIPLVLGPLNSLVWYVPSLRYTRCLGWRMHCGAEVTESSTNKQHHLSASPGGRPHAVAASGGRPPVDVRRRLCAGFLQCGSFVEVYAVGCILSLGGWVVLVRDGCVCSVVAGCWLGGYPVGRDQWGGERVVGGVLPRINIGDNVWGESIIMTGVY